MPGVALVAAVAVAVVAVAVGTVVAVEGTVVAVEVAEWTCPCLVMWPS
jgi:hypothetical protein